MESRSTDVGGALSEAGRRTGGGSGGRVMTCRPARIGSVGSAVAREGYRSPALPGSVYK
jgi:hypothetical protein